MGHIAPPFPLHSSSGRDDASERKCSQNQYQITQLHRSGTLPAEQTTNYHTALSTVTRPKLSTTRPASPPPPHPLPPPPHGHHLTPPLHHHFRPPPHGRPPSSTWQSVAGPLSPAERGTHDSASRRCCQRCAFALAAGRHEAVSEVVRRDGSSDHRLCHQPSQILRARAAVLLQPHGVRSTF